MKSYRVHVSMSKYLVLLILSIVTLIIEPTITVARGGFGVSAEAEDHLDPQDLSVEAVTVIVSQVETILLVEVDQEVLCLEKITSNVMVFLENHKQCR